MRRGATDPWTGVEALHWSVITFTTVGLGDYTAMVPDELSLWTDVFGRQMWWFLFGLLLVAAIIDGVRDHFRISFVLNLLLAEQMMRKFVRSECCCCRRSNKVDPGSLSTSYVTKVASSRGLVES